MVHLAVGVSCVLLGFLLGQIGAALTSRRRLQNIRTILAKELRENYRSLAPYVPAEKHELTAPQLESLLVAVDNFRFVIYREYMGRIDQLTPRELDAVYDTYEHMRTCAALGRTVRDMWDRMSEPDQDWADARAGIRDGARKVLDEMRHAISVLAPGDPSLEELDRERGRGLRDLEQRQLRVKDDSSAGAEGPGLDG